MRAKEARELSDFSLEEIKKKKQIKKSLKKIFNKIQKETSKGSNCYFLYYNRDRIDGLIAYNGSKNSGYFYHSYSWDY